MKENLLAIGGVIAGGLMFILWTSVAVGLMVHLIRFAWSAFQ